MLLLKPLLCSSGRRRLTGIGLALAMAMSLASNANALTYDSTVAWDGTTNVCCFGEANTATYGQTITADATDFVLDSFTFYLDDLLNSDTTEFEAYVFAWTGSNATGPALYQSAPLATTNNGGADGMEAITVVTGGVTLAPGQQYVLLFSASNVFDGTIGTARWGSLVSGAGSGPDLIPGGSFVFMNNSSSFGNIFGPGWSIRGGDLAMQAEFSPIPEPGTALLLGLGLGGLTLGGGRRTAR